MKSRKGRTPGMAHTPLYLLVCAVLGAGVAAPAWADTTTTTMTYDAGDHVTSVTDPRNLVTTYAYDGLGQLWQQVSPDTGTTTYGYDANGHRASMTRADGTVTNYGYDSLDRVVSVSAGGQTQSFAYDNCTNGLGRLCSASDSTGATSYTYTPEGWLTGRGFSISGTTYALGYGYDAMGRLAAVNYPDGHQAVYSYTDGVVTGVTLNLGGTSVTGASNITYLPGNLAMASWQSSNGLTNTLTYDTDGRLTGISVPNVQSLAFSYDTADRIASLTNGVDPSQSENYDYDDQSRLTGAYGTANTESYAYDADGNRIWQTVNGSVANFGISATSNRLVSISGAATQSYGYDAQGNTTTVNGVTTYQYNPFNRLSSTSGASDYVNPGGQRLRKVSGAGTSYFVPQGGSLMAEYTNGAWVDYLWLNGRLIGRASGAIVDAIHDDQTGRPQVATDASGAVVWKANNQPFSRVIAQDAIGGLNIGFPGQYYDIDRGTWNNGFRGYNAGVGRYIESDPIGLAGGVNTYAYVGGNPLINIDPLGLDDSGCVINPANCGWTPQTSPFNAAGIALTVSTANLFTSGGGGVYGLNVEYTDDTGWHLYDFYTPNKCPSSGFNPGVSLTVNIASGSGSWTGPFEQADGSALIFAGGYFQTPDTGYVGGQLGLSAGTPAGIGQTIANYKVIW